MLVLSRLDQLCGYLRDKPLISSEFLNKIVVVVVVEFNADTLEICYISTCKQCSYQDFTCTLGGSQGPSA